MKLFRYLLIIPSLLLFLNACDEDDAEELAESVIQNSTGNSIEATIDGQAFKPALVTGTSDSTFVVVGGVSGISANYPSIAITIPKAADPQTYNYPIDPLDTSNNQVAVVYNLNDSTNYTLNSGSFQLTVHDKNNRIVEGTFQGTLYQLSTSPDSVQLTSGSLKVTYN